MKRPTMREIKKEIRAHDEKWAGVKALDAKKVEKLERLAEDPGATPAEAANARGKAATLRSKAKPRHGYEGRPLPPFEEWEKRPKGKRPKGKQTRGEPRPVEAPRLASSNDGAEIPRLKQEIARLQQEVARLKHASEPAARAKPGRKPLGDRAMTAAERMRKMRSQK